MTPPWPLSRVAVSGVSMAPTYLPGDFLLVRRRRPRVGDVAVVRRPLPPSLVLVKRVARVDAGGAVWVESDNPYAEAADDSRTFGVVPADHVLGTVVARYWPPRRRLRG